MCIDAVYTHPNNRYQCYIQRSNPFRLQLRCFTHLPLGDGWGEGHRPPFDPVDHGPPHYFELTTLRLVLDYH